jgi:hypothetical protein
VVGMAGHGVWTATKGAGDEGGFPRPCVRAVTFRVTQAEAVVTLDESGEGVELLDSHPASKEGRRGLEQQLHTFSGWVIEQPDHTP